MNTWSNIIYLIWMTPNNFFFCISWSDWSIDTHINPQICQKEPCGQDEKSGKKRNIIIAAVVAATLVALISLSAAFIIMKKKRKPLQGEHLPSTRSCWTQLLNFEFYQLVPFVLNRANLVHMKVTEWQDTQIIFSEFSLRLHPLSSPVSMFFLVNLFYRGLDGLLF